MELEKRFETQKKLIKTLKSTKECLIRDKDGTLTLAQVLKIRKSNIAGRGMYAEVFHANVGQFRIAVKMHNSRSYHDIGFNDEADREGVVILTASRLVETGTCPNFPLCYAAFPGFKSGSSSCKTPKELIPRFGHRYRAVVMENLDVSAESKRIRSQRARLSLVLQALIATYSLEKQGFYHNDVKLDNIMGKTIKPGGVFWYRVEGEDVYVPNAGMLWVLLDFSVAQAPYTQYTYHGLPRQIGLLIRKLDKVYPHRAFRQARRNLRDNPLFYKDRLHLLIQALPCATGGELYNSVPFQVDKVLPE
jgi:hypothetical protein